MQESAEQNRAGMRSEIGGDGIDGRVEAGKVRRLDAEWLAETADRNNAGDLEEHEGDGNRANVRSYKREARTATGEEDMVESLREFD